MRHIRGLFHAALSFLALASPSWAQNESCQHRTVPLSVYDSAGRTVNGLTPSYFEAKYRGQPVKILSIVPDNRPHRVVILLDASSSMREVWRPALAAASELVETALHNAQVALIIFTEKIQEQIDFSFGQKVVAERLRQIRSDKTYTSKLGEGRTALYDALLSALGMLGHPTSADSIYVVSDTADNASHTTFDHAARQLTSSGARLFLVALFRGLGYRNRTLEELNGPNNLVGLAQKTGREAIAPYREGIPTNAKEAAQIARGVSLLFENDQKRYYGNRTPSSGRQTWKVGVQVFSREKKAIQGYPDLLPS